MLWRKNEQHSRLSPPVPMSEKRLNLIQTEVCACFPVIFIIGMPFRRHRSISVAPQPTDPPPFNSFDFVSHNPMRAAHSTTFTPAPSSNQNHLQSSSTAFPRRNSLHTLEAPNSLRHYNHSAPSPHIRLTLEQHEELKKLKKELKQRRKREKERERVSMGTKISEGHANYVLMYDMLTGNGISILLILFDRLVGICIFILC